MRVEQWSEGALRTTTREQLLRSGAASRAIEHFNRIAHGDGERSRKSRSDQDVGERYDAPVRRREPVPETHTPAGGRQRRTPSVGEEFVRRASFRQSAQDQRTSAATGTDVHHPARVFVTGDASETSLTIGNSVVEQNRSQSRTGAGKRHGSSRRGQDTGDKLYGKKLSGPSVSQLWPRAWGVYSDNPERDSLDGNLPSSNAGTTTAGSGAAAAASSTAVPVAGVSSMPSGGSSSGGGGRRMFGRRQRAVSRTGGNMAGDSGLEPGQEEPSAMADDAEQAAPALVWRETEPCTQVWTTLSGLYGRLVVLISVAFCVTEMTDSTIIPLTYQGTFMMYLYVVSIVTILSIYASVITDSLHKVTASKQDLTAAADPELASLASFGTLRRAHISPASVSRNSFYLRVGALVFGVGTLVFNGLEIAMHTTSTDQDCSGQLAFAHPILQAMFTFLQMHFMFVNSEVVVEKFGVLARFGLTHLIATNLSVWFRIIIWDSAHHWIHFARAYIAGTATGSDPSISSEPIALKLEGFPGLEDLGYSGYIDLDQTTESNRRDSIGLRESGVLFYGDPYGSKPGVTEPCQNSSLLPIAASHVQRVDRLYQCYNSNTLGQMWTQSMPYLMPFIVEYSLIASAVIYILWTRAGGEKTKLKPAKRMTIMNGTLDVKRNNPWRTDCRAVSKGLFLGLLSLVGGVVVLIIFFVLKDTVEFRDKVFWMVCGTQLSVLFISVVMTLLGFRQIRRLSLRKNSVEAPLDAILSSVTIFGVYLIGIFGMIVGGFRMTEPRYMTLFILNTLLIVQATMQCMLVAESRLRYCCDRQQQTYKPGRQVITFLLFANITLWMLDTLMAHHWLSHEMQFSYYGFLTWGVISRIGLPLMIFFRFHQAVILIGIWKKTYKTRID